MSLVTVGFQKSSGDTLRNFSAVSVTPDFEVEEDRYSDIDYVRHRRVLAKNKKWIIRLGMINESDMDYLQELAVEEAPQMVFDDQTYQVEIQRINARFQGGEIIAINRYPEP